MVVNCFRDVLSVVCYVILSIIGAFIRILCFAIIKLYIEYMLQPVLGLDKNVDA